MATPARETCSSRPPADQVTVTWTSRASGCAAGRIDRFQEYASIGGANVPDDRLSETGGDGPPFRSVLGGDRPGEDLVGEEQRDRQDGEGDQHLEQGEPPPVIHLPAPSVSYTHLRAHETRHDIVCRL